MSLNLRQQRFVTEYLKSGNATQSAITAGYSERSAAVQGFDLLRNPKILEKLTMNLASEGISIERWKQEVVKYAFDEKPVDDFTHDHKVKYTDLLGKHLGAYQDANVSATAFQINIHLGD